VAATPDELASALTSLDAYDRDWAERYDAFVRRFCPHEDGGAGARVVARLTSVLAG
jgi:CDP-glycerol glycerophosphotransferase